MDPLDSIKLADGIELTKGRLALPPAPPVHRIFAALEDQKHAADQAAYRADNPRQRVLLTND